MQQIVKNLSGLVWTLAIHGLQNTARKLAMHAVLTIPIIRIVKNTNGLAQMHATLGSESTASKHAIFARWKILYFCLKNHSID